MLTGLFASFLVGYYTRSLMLALAAGALAGVLMALLMALCCIRWHCNHVVVGITLNMFALGCTSFWYRVVFGVTTSPPKADVSSGTLPIPGLSSIPAIGEILFDQSFLFYVSVIIVAVSFIVLRKTQFGLQIPRPAASIPRRRKPWAFT